MIGKASILCAVRNARSMERLCAELEDGERCTLSIVTNGEDALASACAFVPDILVVDAVLPRIDGLAVVDCLRAWLGVRMPRVIGGSETAFSDQGFARRGADAVVRVPWDMEQLRRVILEQMQALNDQIDWERLKDAYTHAGRLLERMGMHKALKGFVYLSWAAALAYENEARLYAVGEELYRPVARHFGTTPQAVERLIRHAVESTMDAVGARSVYGFFGNTIDSTRGKPTNAQVIGMLVQRMRVR